MKNNKTFLKIGFILGILIIIHEISYMGTGNGVGLPVLIIALAALIGYIYYYLLNQ